MTHRKRRPNRLAQGMAYLRAASLTPERRREIAILANKASVAARAARKARADKDTT